MGSYFWQAPATLRKGPQCRAPLASQLLGAVGEAVNCGPQAAPGSSVSCSAPSPFLPPSLANSRGVVWGPRRVGVGGWPHTACASRPDLLPLPHALLWPHTHNLCLFPHCLCPGWDIDSPCQRWVSCRDLVGCPCVCLGLHLPHENRSLGRSKQN